MMEDLKRQVIEFRKQGISDGESTFVFRDRSFADGVAKTNLDTILKQHGLEHVRSL